MSKKNKLFSWLGLGKDEQPEQTPAPEQNEHVVNPVEEVAQHAAEPEVTASESPIVTTEPIEQIMPVAEPVKKAGFFCQRDANRRNSSSVQPPARRPDPGHGSGRCGLGA